ncbi:MAG TPA: MerR family transcriptional regulator [Caulobacteraceae bacterium]|nr:MerR family transcriptional regulator [Caulobacteraceae bacterium]
MTKPPPATLRIGALARLSGQSVHAIRWYEAQGLIPGVERDRGGRRTYVADHVEHLRFLDRLRITGMTIAEMRRYCELSMRGWRTLPERQALLREHRRRVEAEIADLHAALDMIDAKVAWYGEWAENRKRPPPLPEPPPRRRGRRPTIA